MLYISAMNTKSIFQYTDYRAFLRDYYNSRKDTGYSFRQMNSDLGFSSPNYLKLIMDGERHIGRNSIPAIISGLKMLKTEGEYFSYLLFFAKAKTDVDRNFYFGQIARIRRGKLVGDITPDQLSWYSSWYNPIIRELAVGKKYEDIDFSELGKSVSPSIDSRQARRSVDLLLELAFLLTDEQGIIRQADPVIHAADQLGITAIKQYHSKMIELGKESIDRYPSEKREISTVTARISESGFARIKERIQEFRQEILTMIHDDTDVDRVVQINMQMFPVSLFPEADNE